MTLGTQARKSGNDASPDVYPRSKNGRSVATKQEPSFRVVTQLSRYGSGLQFRNDRVGSLVDREELVRHGESVALLLTHQHDKLYEVGFLPLHTHAVGVGELSDNVSCTASSCSSVISIR